MKYLFYIAIGVLIASTVTSVMRFNKLRKVSGAYIENYRKVLKHEDYAYEDFLEYMANESDEKIYKKCYAVKMYAQMVRGLDIDDSLSKFEIKYLFYLNDEFSDALVDINCDSLLFVILAMNKALINGDKEKADAIFNAFNAEDFKDRVEYRIMVAIYNGFNGGDTTFFDKLLEGDYEDCHYYKNIIGIFKNMAIVYKVYFNQEVSEDDKKAIPEFAKVLTGRCLLEDLGLYDNYKETTE